MGVHQYEYGKGRTSGYTVPVMSHALAAGKPVWMTGWNSAEWGADPSMANGLILANLIHMDMTVGQMSAATCEDTTASGVRNCGTLGIMEESPIR